MRSIIDDTADVSAVVILIGVLDELPIVRACSLQPGRIYRRLVVTQDLLSCDVHILLTSSLGAAKATGALNHQICDCLYAAAKVSASLIARC